MYGLKKWYKILWSIQTKKKLLPTSYTTHPSLFIICVCATTDCMVWVGRTFWMRGKREILHRVAKNGLEWARPHICELWTLRESLYVLPWQMDLWFKLREFAAIIWLLGIVGFVLFFRFQNETEAPFCCASCDARTYIRMQKPMRWNIYYNKR